MPLVRRRAPPAWRGRAAGRCSPPRRSMSSRIAVSSAEKPSASRRIRTVPLPLRENPVRRDKRALQRLAALVAVLRIGLGLDSSAAPPRSGRPCAACGAGCRAKRWSRSGRASCAASSGPRTSAAPSRLGAALPGARPRRHAPSPASGGSAPRARPGVARRAGRTLRSTESTVISVPSFLVEHASLAECWLNSNSVLSRIWQVAATSFVSSTLFEMAESPDKKTTNGEAEDGQDGPPRPPGSGFRSAAVEPAAIH